MGGYELLEELGRGAMGTVHRAKQHGLDRVVALKRVVAPFGQLMSEDYLLRFRHEAQGMSRVSHPNLVRVFDCGQLDGVPYIAMELVDGAPLESLIANDPVSVRRQADELIVQIARGVAALHHARLVHRDLKPGNVMVEPGGRAVVMDLGLVKDLTGDGTRLTGTGECVGTPRYLAPEVVLGEPVTYAADVWALGCIYFEMHTGRTLIPGVGIAEVMLAIASYQLPVLDDVCPEIPPERLALLKRMLARAPNDRPRDAARVLALLEDPKPLRARRTDSTPGLGAKVPGPADRTSPGRPARRRWAAFAGVCALLATGAALLPEPRGAAPAPSATQRASPSAAPGSSAAPNSSAPPGSSAPPASSAAPGSSAPPGSSAAPATPEAGPAAAARAKLVALAAALETADPARQDELAAALVDACAAADPAVRPRLRGRAAGLAGKLALDRAGQLKSNAFYIGLDVASGEKATGYMRDYRAAIDALLVVMSLTDELDAPAALAVLGTRGGFLLNREFLRLDPRAYARLESMMREMSIDGERGYAALLALAAQDHSRDDHVRENARRNQAIAHFELRYLTGQALGWQQADTWYAVLLAAMFCKAGDRAAQLKHVEARLAAGRSYMPDLKLAHREMLEAELVHERAALKPKAH